MKRHIWVTTKFTGFHCWPDAPEIVGFLRNLHRHIFGVRVEVEVDHANRNVEFFILKTYVDRVCGSLIQELIKDPSKSCEMMAEFIGEKLQAVEFKVVSVSVDEDGENGGQVFFNVKTEVKTAA